MPSSLKGASWHPATEHSSRFQLIPPRDAPKGHALAQSAGRSELPWSLCAETSVLACAKNVPCHCGEYNDFLSRNSSVSTSCSCWIVAQDAV